MIRGLLDNNVLSPLRGWVDHQVWSMIGGLFDNNMLSPMIGWVSHQVCCMIRFVGQCELSYERLGWPPDVMSDRRVDEPPIAVSG